MIASQRKLLVIAVLTSVFACNDRAFSQEDDPPETRVVVRVSREFLRRHLNPYVETSRPVDRILFGAHVTGTSVTQGDTNVVMTPNREVADVTLRFAGTTISRTVAERSGVQVWTTSETTFEATRIVHFDGVRFSAEPTTIVSSQRSTTDRICTPGGLRGRIAYRRAVQQVEANRLQADAIAQAENRTLVLAQFNRESDKFVEDLNGIVPVERTIALLLPKTREYINHLETTPEYLLASPGPKDAVLPELPKEAIAMKAPVEVWIKGRPEGERQRKALEMWGTLNAGLNRFRAKAKGEEPKVEGLKLAAVEDWWVIKIGEDLAADWIERKLENRKDGSAN